MSKTKYKKALGVFICIIYLFCSFVPYIGIKAEASTALDTYAPSVSIGQPLPQNFSIIDISNFLSHVLDSAAGGVRKNLGFIWNRIVDSGYCPGNQNTHRHSFIYGLTSTSITADLQQPSEGYYCYCEYCGQLAGNLIKNYIRDTNIDSEGNIYVYPSYVGVGYRSSTNWDYQLNQLHVYGVDFTETVDGYGYVDYHYDRGYNILNLHRDSGYLTVGWAFDVADLNPENLVMYGNITKREVNRDNIYINTYTYTPPITYQITDKFTIDDKYFIAFYAWAQDRNVRDTTWYNTDYVVYLEGTLPEEELKNNFNYDNIQAPIAYVNNGTLIYGGYSSSIIDTDSMIYTDPSSGIEYEIDSMEYDYSTNTYTLDISDLLNGITVEFGVDGIRINENGQDKQYFYVTNPLTPIYPLTDVGTSTGSVNLDGTINLTVNQVSSNSNAYITTNEDIPQGLRDLRETLATMFVELPEMTGEFTDFMQSGFNYIPDEVMTLVVFGVSVAVFVGIFKLFWR